MWTCRIDNLERCHGLRYFVLLEGKPLPYADVLHLLQQDTRFRDYLTTLLIEAPYSTLRWETPPITTTSATRQFEFVLLRCDALERSADPTPFKSQFDSAPDSSIVTFHNLGRDAVMVVPRPLGPESAYGHLAAFLRGAPATQIDELWRSVGTVMQARLDDRPVWLSTAGLGVPWLHVRLDDRPKYYGFQPYIEASS